MVEPGRKEELWRLYEECKQEMFAYALAILRSRSLAEDVVHDAIAEVARHDRPIDHLKAYLFRTIRNGALRQTMLRNRLRPLEESDVESFLEAPDENDPARSFQEKEDERLLALGLEQIAGEQKEVIVLHLFSGLKFREISEALDEPLATITSRYRRGIEALAHRMKECGYEAQ